MSDTKFQYSGPVTIKHLNTRKEGEEGAEALTLDLKLRAVVDKSAINCFDDQIADPLFTDIGAVKNPMMGPITFDAKFKDYQLNIGGLFYSNVSLKKFVFEAKDVFSFVMSFTASFQPSGNEVGTLAEYLQDELEISLESATSDLFEEK